MLLCVVVEGAEGRGGDWHRLTVFLTKVISSHQIIQFPLSVKKMAAMIKKRSLKATHTQTKVNTFSVWY